MIALHTGRRGTCADLSDRYMDATLREIDCQCQTNWSTADDQHLRIDWIAHGDLLGLRPFDFGL
jgi:hypothetical protein